MNIIVRDPVVIERIASAGMANIRRRLKWHFGLKDNEKNPKLIGIVVDNELEKKIRAESKARNVTYRSLVESIILNGEYMQ